MTFLKHCKTGLLAFWLAPKNHGKSGLHHEHVAPHEKTERRSMNAFHLARPRGTNAPAKLPVQRKKAAPITVIGTTRVMNARGLKQATLAPSHRSISIEGREQGRASADKRSKLIRGMV